MSRTRHRPAATASAVLAALLIAVAGCGGSTGSGAPPPADDDDAFDGTRAFADLRGQVEFGPRPSGSQANRRLAHRLASRLRGAGVRAVRLQRPVGNVVGLIPGRGDGFVVLGAHYDTKGGIPGFVGANDGASGVAVVLELARTLPRPMPGPSLAIALFDGEEARGNRDFEVDGTRGSRQYVEYARTARQGSPPLAAIEAMVLLDMVGDCDLAIPRERSSDPALYELFADADPELFDGAGPGVTDDHTPFLGAGVRSVDLIDFDYGPGPSPGDYWHTAADDLDAVCPESLDAVGGAVLRALPRIDGR